MKYFFKAFISILLISACIFVPKNIYSITNSDEITDEIYKRREKYFYGTLEMWQIDCFEGGTGSRTNWLKSITSAFEKKHNGVYVNVNSISVEVANKLISEKQKFPDIISYGEGVAISTDILSKIDVDLSCLLPSLLSVSNDYAVPWCMGAYFVFGNADISKWGSDGNIINGKKTDKKIYSVGVGVQNNYSAETALKSFCTNDFSKELSLIKNTPSEIFSAYNYSETVNRFLGTQRDFYRFKNVFEKNMQREYDVTFISTYNDLFQFVSVINSDDEKRCYMAELFVNYLLEADVQSKISQVGLFPVTSGATPIYAESCQQILWEEIKTSDFVAESRIF